MVDLILSYLPFHARKLRPVRILASNYQNPQKTHASTVDKAIDGGVRRCHRFLLNRGGVGQCKYAEFTP